MSWVKKGAAVLVASAAALVMAAVSPGVAGAGLTGGPHPEGTVLATFASA